MKLWSKLCYAVVQCVLQFRRTKHTFQDSVTTVAHYGWTCSWHLTHNLRWLRQLASHCIRRLGQKSRSNLPSSRFDEKAEVRFLAYKDHCDAVHMYWHFRRRQQVLPKCQHTHTHTHTHTHMYKPTARHIPNDKRPSQPPSLNATVSCCRHVLVCHLQTDTLVQTDLQSADTLVSVITVPWIEPTFKHWFGWRHWCLHPVHSQGLL